MMPKCTLGPSTLFIKDDTTGEMVELGNINRLELEEIHTERETYNEGITYIPQSTEVSVSYKFKKISRKRFIKLLMARKIQRNAANELAKCFLDKRGYYSYIDLVLFDTGVI